MASALAAAMTDPTRRPVGIPLPNGVLYSVALLACLAAGRPSVLLDPAFILCTSGSTGEPKAIVYSQRGIMHQVAALIDGLHFGAQDRFLMVTTASAIAGQWYAESALRY